MMNFFRKHWYDIGAVVAVGVCLYLFVSWGEVSKIQVFLLLSFVAILLHQFEEYRWPGYFAGLFNVVIFKSDMPDRYPLNTQSAMIVNILIAYLFYLLPIFFQNVIWLGMAPVFMGFFQFIWHGVFANRKAKTIYNPGLGAVVLLHIPVGGAYMNYIISNDLVTVLDWILGTIYFVIATYLFIVRGNMMMKNKKSIYNFSSKQLGPYDNTFKQ